MTTPDPDAIRNGTADALLAILDHTGHWPGTRQDILDAIENGTHQALANHITITRGDLTITAPEDHPAIIELIGPPRPDTSPSAPHDEGSGSSNPMDRGRR